MRVKFVLLVMFVGAVALLLNPTPGRTQFQGRGGRGGGRGGRGGFDPAQMFDRMAQGRTSIAITELRFGAQDVQAWAAKNGITSGQITRDQYVAYSQSPEAAAARERMRAQWGGRGGRNRGGAPGTPQGGGPATGGPPGANQQGGNRRGGRGGWDVNQAADFTFLRADKNGNGVLEPDEMSETLRAELDKWDTNKDKLIDREEYRAYYKAWVEKQQADRGGARWGLGGPAGPDDPATPIVPKFDLDKKVTVYRAGKLPKDLPAWFKDTDLDGDAQIALWEWKEKGGTVAQFQKFDRNGDGFLTYEEVLKGNMLALKEDPLTGTPVANGAGGPSDWSARMFDRFANGKPTLVIADVAIDDMRAKMLEWAQGKNITNGQLTREQFASYMDEQRQARGFGGRRGGPRGGGFRGPRGGG